MNEHTTQQKAPSNGRFWSLLPIFLLVFGVGMASLLLFFALNDPSFAVEKDYYQKALHWDQHMAQERKNKALGWRIVLKTSRSQDNTLRLEVRVAGRDKMPHPSTGMQIVVRAFHNARAAKQIVQTLKKAPQKDVFFGLIPSAKKGLWEFRFVVQQGKTRFTQTIQREV